MPFQPLSYDPQTRRERLAGQAHRLVIRARLWTSGIPTYRDDHWRFLHTLRARHIALLIATDPACPRTLQEITAAAAASRRSSAPFHQASKLTPVAEADVAAALAELREHGLTDKANRLRHRIVIAR